MEPISFPQQTKVLLKPSSMTDEECGSLPVYNDGVHNISCHRASWKERIKFLFTGKVWLWVISGHTQPPICVTLENPWPNKPKEEFDEEE